MINLLKPAWKSKNLETRRRAVQELSAELQTKELEQVVLKDTDFQNRKIAVHEIQNVKVLQKILEKLEKQDSISKYVEQHFEKKLLKIALETQDFQAIESLLSAVKNKHTLEKIILKHNSLDICLGVFQHLKDESSFYQIALNVSNVQLALAALEKVVQPQYLKGLAENAKLKEIRKKLETLFKSGESQKKSPVIIQDSVKANWIIQRLESLSVIEDSVKEEFDNLSGEWSLLKSQSKIEEQKLQVFDQLSVDFMQRYDAHLESQKLKEDSEVDFIEEQDEMEFISATENNQQTNDELEVAQDQKKKKEVSDATIGKLEELEKHLKEVAKLLEDKNFNRIEFDCLRLLKECGNIAQIKSVKKHSDFESLGSRYQDLAQQFYELRSWFHWSNLNKKKELCQKISQVTEQKLTDKNAVIEKYTSFFKIWSAIGMVEFSDKEEIKAEFSQALEGFQEQYHEFLQSHLEEQKKYLSQKMALAKTVSQLAETEVQTEDWKKVTRQLKEYQKQWKEIKTSNLNEEQKVWKQFRKANDSLFSRYAEYMKGMREEYNQNLKVKKDYCNEVEQLAGFEQTDTVEFIKKQNWEESLDRVKRLQQQWKDVGFGGNQDYRYWERFQIACNYIFDVYRSSLDKEINLEENLKEKQRIIAEMQIVSEQTITDSQWEKIQILKKEWSDVGPISVVDFKQSNKKLLSIMKKMRKLHQSSTIDLG